MNTAWVNKFIINLVSIFIPTIVSALTADGQSPDKTPWLHIYTPQGNEIYRTKSIAVSEIGQISHQRSDDSTFSEMTVQVSDGSVWGFSLVNESAPTVKIGKQIATMYIDIENNEEIVDKERYLNARIWCDGNSVAEDFPPTEVKIKGRGNSTWNFVKKPWRLKFDKKQEWFGMAKAKNYALIANFIDPTNMRNTVAFKIAEMLKMPWTNHSIPVNIVMNGSNRGLYMLTEKIGINSGSVDIDENEGILWEMDTNFDEDYKFRSPYYGLPVMVKDPDFDELAEEDSSGQTTGQSLFNKWKTDFEKMEAAVYGHAGEDWADYIDLNSVANYVFVCSLTGNHEPTWPKSVYLYKESQNQKYFFGPVWDFDWAYTFGGNYQEGAASPRDKWIALPNESGGRFFRKLCGDSRFKEEYIRIADEWYDGRLSELLTFIDEYAELIAPSAYADGELWPSGCSQYKGVESSENFYVQVERLKQFLIDRLEYIHSDSNHGLY